MHSLIRGYRKLLQSAVWQQAELNKHNLTSIEMEWLLCAESLTSKLKQHCTVFRVQVLNQQWSDRLLDGESAVLALSKRYLVREVFLYGDGQRWIFARTVIPEYLCQQFPQLLEWGETPLGEFLFQHKLERGKLEWSKINTLAARRSRFSQQTDGLLVTELFLEDFGYLT